MRIGHGFDVHRFSDEVTENTDIMLGGVAVPSERALIAHSDGDVVIHALCDALLGAAALGDIGQHFPDTDANYENADSRDLLREVASLLNKQGWRLGNADITIVAETPRVSAYKVAMQQTLAADMGAVSAQVNVKATTTEKLGFAGRKEGIGCHAVVLLMPLSASA